MFGCAVVSALAEALRASREEVVRLELERARQGEIVTAWWTRDT